MGELVSLDQHRRRHAASAPGSAPARGPRLARATFLFDLALPETYFAAERVERFFAGVRWEAADARALGAPAEADLERAMAQAEARAAVLGVPLVWPDPYPPDARPAMRVASAACELGRGAAFVLAAGRLAYCGGFDLRDPEVLAEAAAAASLPLELCLGAAHDDRRDAAMEEAARRLSRVGATALPALRLGRTVFSGEERLPEALAALTASSGAPARRPATG